ncbi:uncharacterized protein LOC132804450 [Ziziphus jujuba]|uniref:Uncharacterized protein LOC132804450 n=1 Tax=Ziziphus jujuba TaxID=326968 RepID=A0ABM4ADM6_ZIZJJ|nr:uncharacterized protein LOC132804450 [Ziziphus jujuba]
MKIVNQGNVIKFIKENIIHRFGIPETITADRGTVFTSEAVETFTKEYGIKLTHSTPYFAQANGQAEAINKVLKGILKKMVDDNLRDWHSLLSETLWAYRTSKRSGTRTTPFALTYGHDAILPMEVTVRSLWIAQQHNLTPDEYSQAMMQEIEELDEVRLAALDHLQIQKKAMEKVYNKRVRFKDFGEGDLVWKAILPIGSKDPKCGKWSLTWEGPFTVTKILGKRAYQLQDMDGIKHSNSINSCFLEKFYPTSWEAHETMKAKKTS